MNVRTLLYDSRFDLASVRVQMENQQRELDDARVKRLKRIDELKVLFYYVKEEVKCGKS